MALTGNQQKVIKFVIECGRWEAASLVGIYPSNIFGPEPFYQKLLITRAEFDEWSRIIFRN
jgi:hypothetical protein